MSKICSNCGAELSNDSKFCNQCGQPLIKNDASKTKNEPITPEAKKLRSGTAYYIIGKFCGIVGTVVTAIFGSAYAMVGMLVFVFSLISVLDGDPSPEILIIGVAFIANLILALVGVAHSIVAYSFGKRTLKLDNTDERGYYLTSHGRSGIIIGSVTIGLGLVLYIASVIMILIASL